MTIDVIDHGGEIVAWRLVLRHPDAGDAEVTWSVVATITCGESTRLGIRLDRSSSGALRPLASRPRPPRLVQMVLEDEHLSVMDAGRPVRAQHGIVRADDADGFAEFVLSADRRLPVVGVTPRDDDLVDVNRLVRDNVGAAHVVIITNDGSWALSDHLPDGLNVYGGAVRIWWPGLSWESVRWDHPLWTGDRSAPLIRRQVEDRIREVVLTRAPVDPVFAQLEQLRRRREVDELRQRSREVEQDARERASRTMDRELVAATDALAQELTEMTTNLEAALDLAQEAEDRAEAEAARADEAERRVWQLTSERDSYRHQLESGRATGDLGESGIEADFVVLVQDRLSEIGCQKDFQRPFAFGRRFFESLESLGESYVQKAVRACAAVISRDQGLLAALENHALRTGQGGSDPQRARSTDGAKAFRICLERNTPQARRLHYWSLSGGAVEFASVNIHDDLNIPD